MSAAPDEDDGLDEAAMNGRMCIVSRRSLEPDALVRFVLGPDRQAVPDLKRKLPGRGAHVEGRRGVVEEAVRRRLLQRALRSDLTGTERLADELDALLVRSAVGALAMARKAGQVVTGSAKVEAALRTGGASGLLHAREAAEDGIRKLGQARHAAMLAGQGGEVPIYRLLGTDELGLALGDGNVVHAAILTGSAGSALLKRLEALQTYRGESPGSNDANDQRDLHEAAP
ncbi:RNA-binding protein [Aureimonas sp. AU4]|uniref:RNA-binding protein n=1 Tax=Aureimonas sp. AU4 TaxID=1638163 RepID=UPI00244ED46E|nr:RNA-binding protein [Aureimonas sp. AU4]